MTLPAASRSRASVTAARSGSPASAMASVVHAPAHAARTARSRPGGTVGPSGRTIVTDARAAIAMVATQPGS